MVPGLSLSLTRPEAAKSVMAVPTMGISVVAPAAAWAAGVAMAKIRSTPSPTNLEAMVWQADWSFWAFCWSMETERPEALTASTKPSLEASRAACSVSWTTPIL